ncbi:glucosaminidase domain-containing protein [Bacillus sp. USDA818B3_A]|uniref:glucosaminidase domain-containing protein n=1 Tax=Bacillus sp. USDA818B3_A TaxID=2698834 RepID=UPI00136927F3|nr:glucosaminidase domain-containing protein [Bacillus sp. USDA818B3_A]
MNKKIYLVPLTFSLMTAPIAAKAETVPSNTPVTQEQLQSDLSGIKQEKLQVQEEINTLTEKMKEIDQQIAEANTKIQQKQNELIEIQKNMNHLNQESIRITALLTNREQEFKERVSSYYRTEGHMSFMNVILSVNSFGEFIDHFVAYDKIVNEDKKFIEEYIADQNKVASIKENVKRLQDTTTQEKAELEKIKASEENSKKEKELLARTLEEKKKQLEQEEQQKLLALKLLQENEKEIQAIINGIQNKGNVQMINSVIAPFVADAQRLHQEKGVPASITLGQIILESSGKYNGLSGLAFQAKNLFGVKGTGTAGSVYMDTTEYVNGVKITTKAQFASYTTYYDSMLDHAELLLKPRYQKYLKDVTNIADYANGIQKGGYATDPNYATKLLKIIYQYDIYKLDI